MGLTTREVGSSSFNDMISSIDRRSEFVENRAGANVTTNNALISYGLSNSCSILNAPCGYSNGVYPSLRPIQTFGPEEVTNGTFDTNLNYWSTSSWWVWNALGAYHPPTTTHKPLYQQSCVIGKKYLITFDLNVVQGGAKISLGNSSGSTTQVFAANLGTGSYSYVITASAEYLIFNRASSVFNNEYYVNNVSVKEQTDADFQFSRGSSATRVNEKGLIEDVQILSGELVQNGDFSQEGSELVTNGNFATDSDWTKGTGITISGSSANFTGNANAFLTQSGVVASNKTYKATFTVSNYVSGAIDINLGGSTRQGNVSANGTYNFYITVPSGNILYFQEDFLNGFIGSIDNVSVKEVGQNWDFGSAWGIENGKALYDGSSNGSLIQQYNILTSGKKYKASFNVLDNSGRFRISVDGGSSTYQTYTTGNGYYTFEFTSTSTNFRIWSSMADSADTFSIDNISVIEITDDTDLPRINYTNFDYENGEVVPYSGEGSLLLEPQSTNLITYSEKISQYTIVGLSVIDNDTTSPNGLSNASKITETSSGGIHYVGSDLTGGANEYSWSCFLKQGTTRYAGMRAVVNGFVNRFFVNIDLSNGSVVDTETIGSGVTWEYSVKEYPNGWYRLIINAPNTSGNMNLAISPSDAAQPSYSLGLPTFLGNTSNNFYIWGVQFEALSYATSYIPTEGSIKTRLQDAAFGAGSSDLINSTEGVLYVEGSALADDNSDRKITLSDGSLNNAIIFGFSRFSGHINAEVKSGGILQTSGFGATGVTQENNNKFALCWGGGTFKFYLNGTLASSHTNVTSPIGMNVLNFSLSTGFEKMFLNFKCLAVFKEALSDTELQKLTQV